MTERYQRNYWAREGKHWVRWPNRYDAVNRPFNEAMLHA